jgi:hypothetical protein
MLATTTDESIESKTGAIMTAIKPWDMSDIPQNDESFKLAWRTQKKRRICRRLMI